MVAPRFAGVRQFALCLAGGRMTPEGFDVNGNLRVDEPNDPDTVVAIQQALGDLGYDIVADGIYGQGTASFVRQFKIDQQLEVPPGLTQHDGVTGPGTAGRLDELFSPHATIRLIDEYGEPLAGVTIEADGALGTQAVTTDGAGAGLVDLGGPWALTLEPMSVLDALGNLLDRPWPPAPQPQADAVTTLYTDVDVSVEAGDATTVVVVARLEYEVPLAAPLDGAVRWSADDGVRVQVTSDRLIVALQANGGFPVEVHLDPVSPDRGEVPAVLPDLDGWVLPNGYLVRDGDTAESLSELFLHAPDRFGELSDRDPVPGETIFLPDHAVPDWLALATDPVPPVPTPQTWFQVTPDDLLRAFYADADPSPIHDLLDALEEPPVLGPSPPEVMAARAELLATILASPEVIGPEPPVPDMEVPLDGPDG